MAFFVYLRGEFIRHTLDSKPENGFFGAIRQLVFVCNMLQVNKLRVTRHLLEWLRRSFGRFIGAKVA